MARYDVSIDRDSNRIEVDFTPPAPYEVTLSRVGARGQAGTAVIVDAGLPEDSSKTTDITTIGQLYVNTNDHASYYLRDYDSSAATIREGQTWQLVDAHDGGAWISGTDYPEGDTVTYDGNLYIRTDTDYDADHTSSENPTEDTDLWVRLTLDYEDEGTAIDGNIEKINFVGENIQATLDDGEIKVESHGGSIWRSGVEYKAGDTISHNDVVYVRNATAYTAADEWAASTAYEEDDIVKYRATSSDLFKYYQANADFTSTTTFTATNWTEITEGYPTGNPADNEALWRRTGLDYQDEGVNIVGAIDQVDFVGNSVEATLDGDSNTLTVAIHAGSEWRSGTTYNEGDVVTEDGIAYVRTDTDYETIDEWAPNTSYIPGTSEVQREGVFYRLRTTVIPPYTSGATFAAADWEIFVPGRDTNLTVSAPHENPDIWTRVNLDYQNEGTGITGEIDAINFVGENIHASRDATTRAIDIEVHGGAVWRSAVDYNAGDIVAYDGNTYVRTSTAYDTTNTNLNTPADNSTLWVRASLDYLDEGTQITGAYSGIDFIGQNITATRNATDERIEVEVHSGTQWRTGVEYREGDIVSIDGHNLYTRTSEAYDTPATPDPWEANTDYADGDRVELNNEVYTPNSPAGVIGSPIFDATEWDLITNTSNTSFRSPDVAAGGTAGLRDLWIRARSISNIPVYNSNQRYYVGDLVVASTDEDAPIFRYTSTTATGHVAPTSTAAGWQELGGGAAGGTPEPSGHDALSVTVTSANNPAGSTGTTTRHIPTVATITAGSEPTITYTITGNDTTNFTVTDINIDSTDVLVSPATATAATVNTAGNAVTVTFSGTELADSETYTIGFRVTYRNSADAEDHHEDFSFSVIVDAKWYTVVSTTEPTALPTTFDAQVVDQGAFHQGDTATLTIPTTDPETYTAYVWVPEEHDDNLEIETVSRFPIELELTEITVAAVTSHTLFSIGSFPIGGSQVIKITET